MIDADDRDEASYGHRPDFDAIAVRIADDARPNTYTFIVTRKQLELINIAIRAGIGDDGIDNIGLTKHEQRLLAKTNVTEARSTPRWSGRQRQRARGLSTVDKRLGGARLRGAVGESSASVSEARECQKF
jgi:hypothetical protein